MEIKQLKQVTNVESFDFYNEDLLYLTLDKTIPQLPNLDLTMFQSKYLGEIFIKDNYLVWQNGRGNALIYSLKKDEILFNSENLPGNYTFRRVSLFSSELFVVSRKVKGTKEILLLNAENQEFTSLKLDITGSLIQNNFLYNLDNSRTKLSKIDIIGKEIWNVVFDNSFVDFRGISQISTIKKIIAVSGGFLWLTMNSGTLIKLEFNTGKICSTFGLDKIQTKTSNSINTALLKGLSLQIDPFTNKIFGLNKSYYIELDLNNQLEEFLIFDINETMNQHSFNPNFVNSEFPVDENYIYLCDGTNGKIGLFNKKNKSLIWSQKLGLESQGINQIKDLKKDGNKFYALDRFHSLHPFQKENT